MEVKNNINSDKKMNQVQPKEDVDLGILKRLIEYQLKLCNLPLTWSFFITILIAIGINLSDGGSDLGLSLLLFHSCRYKEALMILSIDYAACFLTTLHFVMVSLSLQKSMRVIILQSFLLILFHPFAPSITMTLWLIARQGQSKGTEKELHFLTKLTVTITSMFEAPLQVIATTYLALTDRIETPWSRDKQFCDDFGNCLSLGYFSMFVYFISWIALLKASLDVFSPCDTFSSFVFLLTTIMFRLLCFIGLYTYATFWAFPILIPLLLTSCIVAGRYRKDRSGINLFTTIFCSTFLTTVVAEDPSAKERKSEISDVDRNCLVSISAITSLIHLLIIFSGTLFFYFFIKSSTFNVDPALKLSNEQLTFVFLYLICPLFLISILATVWFFFIHKKPSTHKIVQILINIGILCLFSTVLLHSILYHPEKKGIFLENVDNTFCQNPSLTQLNKNQSNSMQFGLRLDIVATWSPSD